MAKNQYLHGGLILHYSFPTFCCKIVLICISCLCLYYIVHAMRFFLDNKGNNQLIMSVIMVSSSMEPCIYPYNFILMVIISIMKGILQSMAFLQIMHFDEDLCNCLSWLTTICRYRAVYTFHA